MELLNELLIVLRQNPPRVLRSYLLGGEPAAELNTIKVWDRQPITELRFYSEGDRIVSCWVDTSEVRKFATATVNEFDELETDVFVS